jgi:hypothetical protein
MNAFKLLINTLNFLMLSVITVSVVYIALWFEQYEQYIL